MGIHVFLVNRYLMTNAYKTNNYLKSSKIRHFVYLYLFLFFKFNIKYIQIFRVKYSIKSCLNNTKYLIKLLVIYIFIIIILTIQINYQFLLYILYNNLLLEYDL